MRYYKILYNNLNVRTPYGLTVPNNIVKSTSRPSASHICLGKYRNQWPRPRARKHLSPLLGIVAIYAGPSLQFHILFLCLFSFATFSSDVVNLDASDHDKFIHDHWFN